MPCGGNKRRRGSRGHAGESVVGCASAAECGNADAHVTVLRDDLAGVGRSMSAGAAGHLPGREDDEVVAVGHVDTEEGVEVLSSSAQVVLKSARVAALSAADR